MFVSHWMTRDVITATPENSLSEGIRLLKENKVKHLPVVDRGTVVGMLSDRDIKAFSPSAANVLDVYELHYVLAKTKVGELMRPNVVTTTPDTPIETAAMIMFDGNIGCLPVIQEGRLVGIISDRDLFRVLVDITGVRFGGVRICLIIDDRPGSIKEVADVVRRHGFRLQSILTSYEGMAEGQRTIVIRARGEGDESALMKEIAGTWKNACREGNSSRGSRVDAPGDCGA